MAVDAYTAAVLQDLPQWYFPDLQHPADISGNNTSVSTIENPPLVPVYGPTGLPALVARTNTSSPGQDVILNFNASSNTQTCEAWARWTTTSSGFIIANRGSSGQGINLANGSPPAGGGSSGGIWFGIDAGSLYIGLATSSAFNDGLWHHIIGIFTGNGGAVSTAQFNLLIDGAVPTTTATTFGSFSGTPTGVDGQMIGRRAVDSTRFNGDLAGVAFYQSAVSVDHAIGHFQAGSQGGLRPDNRRRR